MSWVSSGGHEDNILVDRRQCSSTGLAVGISGSVGVGGWVGKAQGLRRKSQ